MADVFPLCPTSVIAWRLGNKHRGAADGNAGTRMGRWHTPPDRTLDRAPSALLGAALHHLLARPSTLNVGPRGLAPAEPFFQPSLYTATGTRSTGFHGGKDGQVKSFGFRNLNFSTCPARRSNWSSACAFCLVWTLLGMWQWNSREPSQPFVPSSSFKSLFQFVLHALFSTKNDYVWENP